MCGCGRADRDTAAAAACVLPVLALTLWLLHTHILHEVNGTYHTGQSCYGDLGLHLAYIKSIAVRELFPPVEPMLAGDVAMGYPFLCETVSSVFLLLGAGLRFAYLLPLVPALVAVFGMAWQLARAMLGCAARACLAFWLFLWAAGSAFLFSWQRGGFCLDLHRLLYDADQLYRKEHFVGQPDRRPAGAAARDAAGLVRAVRRAVSLWRFTMQGEARLWGRWPCWCCRCR